MYFTFPGAYFPDFPQHILHAGSWTIYHLMFGRPRVRSLNFVTNLTEHNLLDQDECRCNLCSSCSFPPIYIRHVLVTFLYYVFRQKRFNRFLRFLASLIKNNWTLRKSSWFSCRYKNVWNIYLYLKPRFTKNVNKSETPRQIFPLIITITKFSNFSLNRTV